MTSNVRGDSIPPRRAVVALLAGTALGFVLVAPAVPGLLTGVPTLGSPDPMGAALVGGVLAFLAFTVGLFALYLGLVLIDARL